MDKRELDCYKILSLSDDVLCKYIPKIKKLASNENEYTEMEDLKHDFKNPHVMDIKMGIRTYLEDENDTKGRNDLYLKMAKVSHDALTKSEKEKEAITKKRYMEWRDTSTSTRSLGMRITGVDVK